MANVLHAEGFKYIVFLFERLNVIFIYFIFGDWEKNISVNIKICIFCILWLKKIHCLA